MRRVAVELAGSSAVLPVKRAVSLTLVAFPRFLLVIVSVAV